MKRYAGCKKTATNLRSRRMRSTGLLYLCRVDVAFLALAAQADAQRETDMMEAGGGIVVVHGKADRIAFARLQRDVVIVAGIELALPVDRPHAVGPGARDGVVTGAAFRRLAAVLGHQVAVFPGMARVVFHPVFL